MENAFFSPTFYQAIGWTVIHSLWQATAIAILTAIVLILLRKHNAKVRYLLANMALLTVMLSAIVTFAIYYNETSHSKEEVSQVPPSDGLTIEGLTAEGLTNEQTPILSAQGMKTYFNRHIYLIVTVWAMGVALFILRLLGGVSYVYYLKSRLNFPADEYWQSTLQDLSKRIGLNKTVDLLESAMVRSPLVVGYLKPVILFPIGAINHLSTEQVEAVLAHELAHILRNDYIFNILQSVMEALFYFHPAVWWLSTQVRTEREHCCDDLAVQLCGNSIEYAKSLVLLQEIQHFAPQMALGFATQRKQQMLYRVQRMLNTAQNHSNVMEKIVATLLLLFVVLALSFGETRRGGINTPTQATSDQAANTSNENTPNKPFGKQYLRFLREGKLDSLLLDYEIQNGTYNYTDDTQSATLTVQDRRVIQLTLNGLVITAADMPKFRRLIDKTLRPENFILNDNGNNEEGGNDNGFYPIPPVAPVPPVSSVPPVPPVPPTDFNMEGNGFSFNIDENGGGMVIQGKDGSKVVIQADKKGNQFVITTDKNGKKSTVRTDKKGQTFVADDDGNESTVFGTREQLQARVTALDAMAQTIEGQTSDRFAGKFWAKLAPINDVLKNKQAKLNDRQLKDLEKHVSELEVLIQDEMQRNVQNQTRDKSQIRRQMEQAKRDAEQAQRDVEQAQRDAEQAQRDAEQAQRDARQAQRDAKMAQKDVKFNNWLLKELQQEGLLTNTDNFSIDWGYGKMMVNGKRVPDTLELKYRQEYERQRGQPFLKTSRWVQNRN